MVKYNRVDIYNSYIRDANTKHKYFKYIQKYDNQISHVIRNDVDYIIYINKLNGRLLNKYLLSLKELKELILLGVDLTVSNNNGTILHNLAERYKIEIFKYLVETNYDVVLSIINNTNALGRTALHIVSSQGYLAMARYLINTCNASINIRDNNGFLPIHLYCTFTKLEGQPIPVDNSLNELIGDNINVQNNNGDTMLHCMLNEHLNEPLRFKNKLNLIKYLIDNGANTMIINNNGNTILHVAIQNQIQPTIIMYLIYRLPGLLDLPNNNRITPRQLVYNYGDCDIINALERTRM